MDDYTTKPISGERIAEAIAKVVGPKATGESAAAGPRSETGQEPAGGDSKEEGTETMILDYEELLHRCMGKPNVVHRVLNRFEETAPEIAARIEPLLSSGDTEQASKEAHSLKGASANLAAEPLRAAAAEVERLCKLGADAAALSAVPQLQLELERCMGEIRRTLVERAETT